MNIIEETLKRYFHFSGRSGRREFWTWVLMILAVSVIVVCILAGLAFILDNAYNRVLSSIYKCILMSLGLFWLAMFFPTLTVSVRRLRDVGICPWTLLIPAILSIVTFFVLADIGLSNMDGSPASYSDAFALILSAVTAITWFVFLFLFCLPSKK